MANITKSYIHEIPEGYEARIEGNKVIIELAESEDERIRKGLVYHLRELSEWKPGEMSPIRTPEHYDAWIAYLEKQKEDYSSFSEDQRKYMEKYIPLDKVTLVKLLAERDMNVSESIARFNECFTEEEQDSSTQSLQEAIKDAYEELLLRVAPPDDYCWKTLAERFTNIIRKQKEQKLQDAKEYISPEQYTAAMDNAYHKGVIDTLSHKDSTIKNELLYSYEQGRKDAFDECKKKQKPTEELVYRLNGLMQEYIKEGKDDEEREHRFKCYHLFWEALEDSNFFEQDEMNSLAFLTEMGYTCIPPSKDGVIEKKIQALMKEQKERNLIMANSPQLKEQKPNKCDGCNNVKGCVTCVDGSEWAHYEEVEQKPVDLQVKGDGVYKICPHCKERMIRDDSKVFTSMPPQYGYNCPKCGALEFDTVMYDSPAKGEQKPVTWSEKDEKMMKFTLQFLEYHNLTDPTAQSCMDWLKSLRSIVNANSEKVNVNWREEDERMLADCIEEVGSMHIRSDVQELRDWLKSLPERFNLQPKQEWSEEDEKMWIDIKSHMIYGSFIPFDKIEWIENRLKSLRPQQREDNDEEKIMNFFDAIGDCGFTQADILKLKSIWKEIGLSNPKPHWKPSEVQMNYLCAAVIEAKRRNDESTSGFPRYQALKEIYEELLKL